MILTSLVAALLVTFPAPQAATWRHVSAVPGARVAIAPGSIVRTGGTVSFQSQIAYTEQRAFSDGTAYDRIESDKEADCAAMMLRTTKSRVFFKATRIAETPGAGIFKAAAPGTSAAAELRAACLNQWPAGTN